MVRCDPIDAAATTSSIDQMKGPAATNDQLDGPAVTLSTDQLDVSSAPANRTTPGQHNDPITPSFSYRWRKRDLLITDDIAFTESFSDPPHEIPTPLQYFRRFLSKECMEYIAYQSNVYATQKDRKVLGTSSGEIEQFIGILLLTGVFPCTYYRLYWANFSRFNMIADVMSRNRFELLLRYIHFNDNTNMKPREHPQYNPLFKISL